MRSDKETTQSQQDTYTPLENRLLQSITDKLKQARTEHKEIQTLLRNTHAETAWRERDAEEYKQHHKRTRELLRIPENAVVTFATHTDEDDNSFVTIQMMLLDGVPDMVYELPFQTEEDGLAYLQYIRDEFRHRNTVSELQTQLKTYKNKAETRIDAIQNSIRKR